MPSVKQNLLEHLSRDVYCRLGTSKVHGIGVFALRTIPKGINPLNSLMSYEEVRFSRKELAELPKSVRKQMDIFCYYVKDKVFVPSIGLNIMDMALYLNHSKKPNLRMHKSGRMETLRTIRTGEELMMDYDHSFGDKHTFKD